MCSIVLEKENGRYFTYSEHAYKPVVPAEHSESDGHHTGTPLDRLEG